MNLDFFMIYIIFQKPILIFAENVKLRLLADF